MVCLLGAPVILPSMRRGFVPVALGIRVMVGLAAMITSVLLTTAWADWIVHGAATLVHAAGGVAAMAMGGLAVCLLAAAVILLSMRSGSVPAARGRRALADPAVPTGSVSLIPAPGAFVVPAVHAAGEVGVTHKAGLAVCLLGAAVTLPTTRNGSAV